MSEMLEKISTARILALKDQPYLRHVIMSLNPVENTNNLSTFSVDIKWNLHYNPNFLNKITDQEAAAVILHEAYHILHNHAQRFENSNLPESAIDLWNKAADAAINSELKNSGVNFGNIPVIVAGEYQERPEWLKGMTTEEMFYSAYNKNSENSENINGDSSENKTEETDKEDNNSQNNEKGQDSQNSDNPPPLFKPKNNNPEEPSKETKPQAEETTSDASENNNCGSISDGIEKEWEKEATENLENDDALTRDEQESIIQETFKEFKEHAEYTKPGTSTGEKFEILSSSNKKQVDWRKIFRKIVNKKVASTVGAVNYTYTRRSRRHQGSNFFMPAIRGYKTPEIAFILDTSASMRKKMLEQALKEMEEVLKSVNVKTVDVIQCDTKPKIIENVRSFKDFKIIGRGGTNMVQGIEAAEKLKNTPDIVILITDGYTPWPESPPKKLKKSTFVTCIIPNRSNLNQDELTDISYLRKNLKVPDFMELVSVKL